MKKLLCISAFLIVVSFGCKKNTSVDVLHILQYEKNGQLYSETSYYLNKLIANSYTPCSEENIYGNSDSVLFCFTGAVGKAVSGVQQVPKIEVSYCTKVPQHIVRYNSNGCAYLYNAEDFYALFKKGFVDIRKTGWGDAPNIIPEGFDMIFGDSTGSYVMQNTELFQMPLPAHSDTFNQVEIVDVQHDDFAWSGSVSESDLKGHKVLVTFRFQLKLYGYEAPHNEVYLTNGIWQGYFRNSHYEAQ